jgi:Phospholipase/Carboxylesterase.
LCSKSTDGNKPGSYIEKRVNEIDKVLDQLLDKGIKPKNIFLSGVSAGGWSSLMLMPKVGKKFNSAMVLAPAGWGTRDEINKYPVWRKEIRPRQGKQKKEAEIIKALIFAYEEEKFNRTKELMFLKEKSPETVNIIAYKGGEGHSTYRKEGRINETKKIIKKYMEEQG